jgi:beta-galactosidase
LPGPLAQLAGVAIHDFDPQTNQEQEVEDGLGESHPARVWFDVLEPTSAESIAKYTEGYYAGKSAASINRFGQGRVFYIGTELSNPASYSKLVNALADGAGLSIGPSLPDGVELAVREKPGKRILFLMNYTEKTQTVNLGAAYANALTGAAEPAMVEVPAYDVKVLTAP